MKLAIRVFLILGLSFTFAKANQPNVLIIIADDCTYNDLPLYYFAQDAHHGDTKGHESGDVWFAQKPKEPPPPPIVKVNRVKSKRPVRD